MLVRTEREPVTPQLAPVSAIMSVEVLQRKMVGSVSSNPRVVATQWMRVTVSNIMLSMRSVKSVSDVVGALKE